MYKLYIL